MLFTHLLVECHSHLSAVNVSVKVEYVGLKSQSVDAVSRAVTDVHHAVEGLGEAFHPHFHSIYATYRNHFQRVDRQVCRRKSYLSALMKALHHGAVHGIWSAKTLHRLLAMPVGKELSDHRRRVMSAVWHGDTVARHHLNAYFLTVAPVVLEAFSWLSLAEMIVVAEQQQSHAEAVVQDFLHEVVG